VSKATQTELVELPVLGDFTVGNVLSAQTTFGNLSQILNFGKEVPQIDLEPESQI